jgi:hypothetical protein
MKLSLIVLFFSVIDEKKRIGGKVPCSTENLRLRLGKGPQDDLDLLLWQAISEPAIARQ